MLALEAVIWDVTSDDLITDREELSFTELMGALDITAGDLTVNVFDAWAAFLNALMNSGRIPEGDAPDRVMLKAGEVYYSYAHVHTTKTVTTKTVTTKTYSGGSSGISDPLGLGIRLSTRSSGGRVTAHSQVTTDDNGILAVTSMRTAFLGAKGTLEVNYPNLAGLTYDGAGLSMNVSGRQGVVRVEFERGERKWVPVFAAMIASAHRLSLT